MPRGELETLFARFRERGDLDALGRVFDRCAPRLLSIARHLARDEAAAEDLVQATFLAAIESAERFDASGDLEAWLVGILTNHARRLHAQRASPPGGAPLRGGEARSVTPDGPDIVIVVESSGTRSRSSLVGRVTDVRGRPAVDATMQFLPAGATEYLPAVVASDGTFDTGAMEPGTYSASVLRLDREWHLLREGIEVAEGVTVDLGEFVVPACGVLVVRPQRPRLGDGYERMQLVDADGKTITVDRTPDGVFRSRALPVGRYSMTSQLSNAFAPELEIEIREDERTEIELEYEPATFTTLEFRSPPGMPTPERWSAQVKRGDVVLRSYDGPPFDDGPHGTTKKILLMYFAMPRGELSWSASAGDAVGEGTFTCTGDGKRVVLELHAR